MSFPKWFVVLLLITPLSLAEEKTPSLTRIDPDGINGSLLICGGGNLPDEIMQTFIRFAGNENAHLVIIPTASAKADEDSKASILEPWKKYKIASIKLLHTRDRKQANDPKFVEVLKKATGVWFGGGQQSRLSEAYVGTLVEKELQGVLNRGGIIGGNSAGAAIMSKVMIASGKDKPEISKGFDLLPGAIIDQHYTQRKRQNRLEKAIAEHPHLVGLGVDENTAVLVRGRRLIALGDHGATLVLAASKTKPMKKTIIERRRRFADWTALRRAARDRSGPTFPPEKPAVPEVKHGSLVIVGGGGMPREIVDRFIQLAGGPEAPIVILPTASPDPLPKRSFSKVMFERAGAKDVTVLPARKLKDVEDPKNLAALKRAKGIWFGGGRQWRFIDAYEGTKAHELFHEVLKRGGVIGGSSAGASIQPEYMARGNPLGNRDIMAEGYERGLNFLPGVAVDQHFAQRKRFADMTSLVKTYPQILGIGIDEATALIVEGHIGTVMGRSKVHFYDSNKKYKKGAPDYQSLAKGEKYDLKARMKID